MPYDNEKAGKTSHSDIVKNPDISQFLNESNYLHEPDEKDVELLSFSFEDVSQIQVQPLPKHIFATDGSTYESIIDERMPSTKVGYVKVSTIHISLDEFKSLRVNDGRYVDPFRVAKLRRNKDSLLFVLPGTNMLWKSYDSVRNSFRARVDYELYKPETRFEKSNYKTSLRSTLFKLTSMRPDKMGSDDPHKMILPKCPICGDSSNELFDIEGEQYCNGCGNVIYPSDVLRLWEEVFDFQSNAVAMTRFMLLVEHILPIHYLQYLTSLNYPLDQLSSIAFIIDGPLAIFGTSAWISRPIMKYYYSINEKLINNSLPGIIILGLQKSGQLSDYFKVINKYIYNGSVFPVSDNYRYKYIIASRDPSKSGFGDETYYGQDFLFKTNSGRQFVVALPYPFSSKGKQPDGAFHQLKTDFRRYSTLGTTLQIISDFETDLYENAVILVALAHRYTAISAVPGGKVLDILSKSKFTNNKPNDE